MTKKVAVIGAGILGINTAYFLAKKGMHVSVYDSNRYAGMETSYSNGAQISVCNSETWTQWENVSKGCLLYTSPSPRDRTRSRMPSSA